MIHRLWLVLFGCWAVFLSGAVASVVGSPGVIQAVRLHSLLGAKEAQLRDVQTELARLDSERERLEKSRVAQEHEIRRTLGYAAADEIIFDFTAAERVGF
jgi:hypothetical protein